MSNFCTEDSDELEESTKTGSYLMNSPIGTPPVISQDKLEGKETVKIGEKVVEIDNEMREEWIPQNPKEILKNKLAPKSKIGRQLAARRKSEKSKKKKSPIKSKKKLVIQNLSLEVETETNKLPKNSTVNSGSQESTAENLKISKEKMKSNFEILI